MILIPTDCAQLPTDLDRLVLAERALGPWRVLAHQQSLNHGFFYSHQGLCELRVS